MVKLDILSDPICPWCYIGKAHLDMALAANPGHPFEIEWHPFQLNPDMPSEGMDRRDYLEGKFGGREEADRVYGRIAEAAGEAGLELDLGAIRRTPNTLDAHRLIHWAGTQGRQTQVVASLFQAYFEEGRDIGDADALARIAETAGLDAEAIRELLSSDADSEDIRERDARARRSGVNGVPTFIVGRQRAFPGAQPPELWVRAIEEFAGAKAPAGGA